MYLSICITFAIVLFWIFIFLKYRKLSIQRLLESPSNYYFGKEAINFIDINHPLMRTMDEFCKKNNIYKTGAIISLSGGVDSMVVLACLIKLSSGTFPIYTASINYNQRAEQLDEVDFLDYYCRIHNVKTNVSTISGGLSRKKQTSGPRSEFEEESRKIRFELYEKILLSTSATGIFVGHHKDDIIENIFTNSMKGGNLLNLEVMKETSSIRGINIFRPFLRFHKSVILDFAHTYDIPYFLDTTPKWSRRGKMRNEIFPLLDNVFNNTWRIKLKELGDQSNQWSDYIEEHVITPWFNQVKIIDNEFIMPFAKQPKLIYSNVIIKVMHSMGYHMLKSNSIDKIINNEKKFNRNITLDSGFTLYIDSKNPTVFRVYKS